MGGLIQVNFKPILTTLKLNPDNGLPVVRNGTKAIVDLVSAEVVRNSHNRAELSLPIKMPGLSNKTLALAVLVVIVYYTN